MNIHDHYVEFQIDNVSTSNILPTHVYVYLTSDQKFKNLQKTDVTLQMYNKSETKSVGTIRLSVQNPCSRKKYSLEFVLVSGKELHCNLGKRAIEGMELNTLHTDKFLTITQVQKDVISQTKKKLMRSMQMCSRSQVNWMASFIWMSKTACHLYIYRRGKYRQLRNQWRKKNIVDWESQVLSRSTHQPTGYLRSWWLLNALVTFACILTQNHSIMHLSGNITQHLLHCTEVIPPELHQARIFSIVDAKDGF